MNDIVKCYGCFGEFLKSTDYLTGHSPHPYIGAIHECWLTYSEILAKEFSDCDYFKVHRITVDAYMAQHIGDQKDRRARQSANVHLIALYLNFAKGLQAPSILNFLKQAAAQKRDWPPVLQIQNPKWLTVNDVIKARNVNEHIKYVTAWGKSVWDAYMDHHENIARLYNDFMKNNDVTC